MKVEFNPVSFSADLPFIDSAATTTYQTASFGMG